MHIHSTYDFMVPHHAPRRRQLLLEVGNGLVRRLGTGFRGGLALLCVSCAGGGGFFTSTAVTVLLLRRLCAGFRGLCAGRGGFFTRTAVTAALLCRLSAGFCGGQLGLQVGALGVGGVQLRAQVRRSGC